MLSCSPREKQGGAENRHIVRIANQRSRRAIFDRVHSLHCEDKTVAEIVRQTGFDRRTIGKRIQSDVTRATATRSGKAGRRRIVGERRHDADENRP